MATRTKSGIFIIAPITGAAGASAAIATAITRTSWQWAQVTFTRDWSS